MQHYPDAYLDHWSDIYVMRQIRRHGISLMQFLRAPKDTLARVDRIESAERAVVEPRQHRQEQRAENQLRQRGAVLIQKLWHGNRRRNRADAPLMSRR